MDEYLQWSVDERHAACQQAAATLGLAAESIEKDYWVSLTLRELFGLDVWGSHLTFKGGTSLSKGWKLIDRFSEDIDVVIDREFLGFGGTLSRKAQKRLVEACGQRIRDELLPTLRSRWQQLLPDAEWELAMADAEMDRDEQTVLFTYSPFAAPVQGRYVQPWVKIEFGARSDTDPAEMPTVSPLPGRRASRCIRTAHVLGARRCTGQDVLGEGHAHARGASASWRCGARPSRAAPVRPVVNAATRRCRPGSGGSRPLRERRAASPRVLQARRRGLRHDAAWVSAIRA